jgi:hypothetical protein
MRPSIQHTGPKLAPEMLVGPINYTMIMRNFDVERIAETQYFIRPQIIKSLRQINLNPKLAPFKGHNCTYLDLWQAGFGDRFFDMATFVRLGTAIEVGLRTFHRQHGQTPLTRLISYQSIVSDEAQKRLAEAIYTDTKYDLRSNPHWERMREIMAHRHLFAHRNGLVDNKYIIDIKSITRHDLLPELQSRGYPKDEVFWFEPLSQLEFYIEDARRFYRVLPELQ